ncbi:MAG: acyltransferase family protein [Bosea sp. (in: a-proteobacteria)]
MVPAASATALPDFDHRQLSGIQVVRALAALMVAVHHVQGDAAVLAARFGLSFNPSHALPWMAGVDIFFVVSGFIMVHASRGLFGQPGGGRLFLFRRLARIVPLYWATTLLFLLTLVLLPSALNTAPNSFWQIIASFLFIPTLSAAGGVQPIYSLGWTLNLEMLFYALFALGLVLPPRACVALVSALLLALVGANAFAGPLPLPFSFWGQPIVLEFAAGMGIALLRAQGLQLNGTTRWLLVLAAFLVLGFGQHLEIAQNPFGSLLLRGGPALMLVAAAALGRGITAPSALVRGLAQLGDASYALYLIHPFAMRGLREVFLRAGIAQPELYVVLALLAAVVASVLVWRWFERPVTNVIRRRLNV